MAPETKTKESKEHKPLEKMTVKELKALAMEIPRSTSVHDMKKDELIAFINESRGIKEKSGIKVKDSEKLKTKQAMKAKIQRLKEERMDAQEKKDHKRVDFLRRQLSHLKKLTRKVTPL